ncbi:hypothetical protein [Streptomyces brevispora]|uniref:Uncharacterized protein n=2 Tax=Streptomyces brevispora TaxID=887462 RepID=A0ABZ1FXK4_9ACTN|nr:hypothetical protein [Streptomyces brevispora]WSC11881.1 hypothetical protein OIE64_02810 [Streptomyces brevispora]
MCFHQEQEQQLQRKVSMAAAARALPAGMDMPGHGRRVKPVPTGL